MGGGRRAEEGTGPYLSSPPSHLSVLLLSKQRKKLILPSSRHHHLSSLRTSLEVGEPGGRRSFQVGWEFADRRNWFLGSTVQGWDYYRNVSFRFSRQTRLDREWKAPATRTLS